MAIGLWRLLYRTPIGPPVGATEGNRVVSKTLQPVEKSRTAPQAAPQADLKQGKSPV